MNAVRRALIGGVLVVAALVGVVWVIPTLAGPVVDCGPVDPVTCQEEWRSLLPADGGRFDWWPPPITRVEVLEAYGSGCGSVAYERWFFWGGMVISDC